MRENRIVIVKGTPYEQGVQQGKAIPELIKENINNLKKDLKKNNCDMKVYWDFAKKNVDFLIKEHKDLIEEIKGISEGSNLPYEDILMINIPAYFMQQYFNQECSMILARKPATADGCTYLIKNRDMKFTVHQVVIERHYSNGKVITEVNGAGIVTYPANGLNNKGLAIATTGFWSKLTHVEIDDVKNSHIFVNIHLLLKNCNNVKELVEYLKMSPRMNGLNIIATDFEHAVIIETTRDDMLIKYDDGSGIIVRTNHYLLDDNIKLNPTLEEYPSTFLRYERIVELLSKCNEKIRFQDLFRILSDHKNNPINSICRHPNNHVSNETVSSSMIVLEDFEMWTTPGNPCHHLTLSKLEGEIDERS